MDKPSEERDAIEIAALTHDMAHEAYVLGELEGVRLSTVTEISAPVFDAKGQLNIMVGVSTVTLWSTEFELDAIVSAVVDAALRITRSLEGRSPVSFVEDRSITHCPAGRSSSLLRGAISASAHR